MLPPFAARQTPPRVAAPAAAPEIHTKIEAFLATPGVLLATDYYQIDMRFGPNLRIDAVVVTDLGSQARMKGLRVQVHADQNPNQAAGASFLDLEVDIADFPALKQAIDQAQALLNAK
jgi:hypothetical protein